MNPLDKLAIVGDEFFRGDRSGGCLSYAGFEIVPSGELVFKFARPSAPRGRFKALPMVFAGRELALPIDEFLNAVMEKWAGWSVRWEDNSPSDLAPRRRSHTGRLRMSSGRNTR